MEQMKLQRLSEKWMEGKNTEMHKKYIAKPLLNKELTQLVLFSFHHYASKIL